MYSLVTTPDPVLVRQAAQVKHFDKKLHEVVSGMTQTLLATTDPVGVGLAAPQVGLPMQLFLMKPKSDSPVSVFINPEVVTMSDENAVPDFVNKSETIEKRKPKKGKLLEGCLSIPNIWGHVTRQKEVTISWQDEKGKKHTKLFKGFPAVIIQHEIDHLHGMLFTKHVMQQHEQLYKSSKDENGDDVFDEIKI